MSGYVSDVAETEQQTPPGAIIAGLSAATGIAVIAFAAIERGTIRAYDYFIYWAVTWFHDTNGAMPKPGDELAEGVSGSYADFTPANFQIYRFLFSPARESTQAALYITYQVIILWVGLVVLIAARRRLGLSMSTLYATLAAVVLCAAPVLMRYEDKAIFFTVTLIAAVAIDRPGVWAGVSLGVLFGWTGLGLLAFPLLLLRGSRRARIQAVCAAVVTSIGLLVVAGADGEILIRNRIEREGRDPFWFSIWRGAGDLYSPSLRNAAFLALSAAIILRVHRRRLAMPAALVALLLINMLVSNNTAPTRIVMLLPLGVLVFTTDRARVAWTMAVAVFAVVHAMSVLGWTSLLTEPPTGIMGWILIVFVNAPLLVAICSALGLSTERDTVGAQHPRLESRPVRVTSDVA